MSDTDSFINEVSEEVRKDALYGYVRKYGWIAVLAVLAIVGGATWNEINKANATAQAQATGDALIAALNQADAGERASSLEAVNTEGAGNAVTALLTAAAQQDSGETIVAAETLGRVVVDPDTPQLYRDLAAFKAAMIDTGDTANRRLSLETLATPGGTFALLAQEQLAFLDIEAGDVDAAIARLKTIAEDASVSAGLQQRAQTLLVALGADIAEDMQAVSE